MECFAGGLDVVGFEGAEEGGEPSEVVLVEGAAGFVVQQGGGGAVGGDGGLDEGAGEAVGVGVEEGVQEEPEVGVGEGDLEVVREADEGRQVPREIGGTVAGVGVREVDG